MDKDKSAYLVVLKSILPACDHCFDYFLGGKGFACCYPFRVCIKFMLMELVLTLLFTQQAIVTIADEDGNFLQEAWEHILTCVSRFEHLHLLGEGAPPDATFFALNQNELDKSKQAKPNGLPVLKKGAGKIQYAATAVRRGTYDSTGVGGSASAGITSEQMNNLVSNLNMLEQVGEMSRIFTRSQKLNSEAIVDFVKALCKVSMEELKSTSDPRVFSLTKIVEIAYEVTSIFCFLFLL